MEWSAIYKVATLAFMIGALFGAVANKTNFCAMGAVGDWVNFGDKNRLRAWLLAVGISILSGAHMTLVPRILEGLRENGAEDVLVVLGGTIPNADAEELQRQGVAAVFTPGAPTSEIVEFLRGKVPA